MTAINATFNGKQKPTDNNNKKEKNTFSLKNANQCKPLGV